MKIINKTIILLCLVLFTFTSCEDELTLFPTDSIAVEQSFKNQADFESAAKGIYSAFRRSGYYGATSGAASIYFIPDVISDNVIINANGRRSRESYYDWRYSEDSSSETFWLSAYKVVQRANLILENIENIEASDFRNNIEGEALASRAIAHFDLAKFYASSPAQAAGTELGIPYVTSTASDALPPRNTLDETYSMILADLNKAEGLINEANANTRLSKNAVNAILSRVHLFMGNDQGVVDATNKITGVGEVSLADFNSVWKDASEESVIWKIKMLEVDGVSIGVAWLQESPDGIRSEYNVDLGLFQMYKGNDVRKNSYFETSAFSGIDYNHIVKYRGRLTGDANVVDAKAIRYSEVLLNRAEALANLGSDAMALAALDELRVNRYNGFSSGNETGQALKGAIQTERRLELAFEGQRFFDLKRMGLPVNRTDAGDQADGNGQKPQFLNLPANDFRFNMAIGESEIDANENMTQNAGY
jgi:hypothetical protein